MKTSVLTRLCLAFIAVAVFTSSCTEDDKSNGGEAPSTQGGSKNKLVQDGNTLAQDLEKLKDNSFFKALVTLSKLGFNEESESQGYPYPMPGISRRLSETIINSVNDQNLGPIGLPARTIEGEAETLEEVWEDVVGTYTYNADMEKFDETLGGNSIIILYPLEEDGTDNNVKLTIKEFTTVAPNTDILFSDFDYAGGLPTRIAASLEIDGVEGMTYLTVAGYNSDDLPNFLSTTLTISTFSVNMSYENTGSEVSYSYDLKEGNNTLLSYALSVAGNVSYADIIAIEENEDAIDDLSLTNATYTTQVINTKVEVVIADVSKLIDEYLALDDTATNEDTEEVLNNNITVEVTFANTEQKVGDATIEIDADDNIDFILTFGDGSKVAITDFIDSVFEDLEDELDDLISDL